MNNYFYAFGILPTDLLGNKIERSKMDYPYSYSPFCYYLNGDIKDATATLYSDRLYQWDSEKYNELCKKHFGDKGQIWSGRSVETTEKFLAEYLDKESVKVIAMIEGCNVSNGYPYWCMYVKY